MPMTLREIARATNCEEFLGPEDVRGVSTSRELQQTIIEAQRKERQKFEERRARQRPPAR